jgi:hypothetical protein
VLFTLDPTGPYTYGIAVTLSAVLAALFTYLYLRKIGLGMTGSAAAGWTFACSGYYASRVAAGHLPLLEAYPALPLLLWVVESQLHAQEHGKSPRRWIAAVALSTACVMLAGHPQLPSYSIGAVCFYALWRGGLWRAFWAWGAMVVGVGIAAFALVPMATLIDRSTRVLALAPPVNDVSMPYGRLVAFFLPWRDGLPSLLDPAATNPFHGYPNPAYFWDTVCYTGLLPWIAILLFFRFATRAKLDKLAMEVALFVMALGVAGIALSLPIVHQVTSLIPGTIFRSPARLIYLTEFALAIALGAGVHWAIATMRPRFGHLLVPLLLVSHTVDLGSHARRFIVRGALGLPAGESEIITNTLKKVGDGRAAIDYALALPMDRTVDDIGFFDSIMLARSYRAMLSLAGAPRDLNIQTFNGSEISSRALAAAGVKFVITSAERADLSSEGQIRGIRIYRVPSPSQRAAFFDGDNIRFLLPEQIHSMLRDSKIDLGSVLLLPGEGAVGELAVGVENSTDYPTVVYRRPGSDHIECTVTTGRSGYLRIIESWDPGWSATVDGLPTPIVPALDALLSVPIAPGRHEVRFVYRTPGAVVGGSLSIISLALLGVLMWVSRRSQLHP